MRIDSLLNEGPTSDPNILNLGGASSYKVHPLCAADNLFPLQAPHQASVSDSIVPQILPQNSSHQNTVNPSRDPAISFRVSYSGPTLRSSNAAPSSLEASMPPRTVAKDRSIHSGMSHESGEAIPRPSPSFPGRTLPPLASIPSPPTSGEGPLSPRSIGTGHYKVGSDMGYFPVSRAFYQDPSPQRQQQPFFAPTQQPHGHVHNNALMNFAEVAMGTATVGGRRSLELEAAAEASRRDSGGPIKLEDPIRRNSTATETVAKDLTSHAAISRAGRADGIITSNTPLFLDLDPSLRPGSADSAASTGRTIEEGSEIISRPYAATQDVDASDKNVPLFRRTPEPHALIPDNKNLIEGRPHMTPVIAPPNNPLALPQSALNEPPKCSYCRTCTTGSPLRKVVSHIFGRNKLSTRQIPKNVWVYYCRKHYQRSRYRNPKGFARQQVVLVKRQCERLQLWGGVRDWVIKVRRREEIRMTREGEENGEEADEAEEDIEEGAVADEEPEPNDGSPTSGENSRRNSTAAAGRRSSASGSNWIMNHTGMEKTITDIYRLLDEIEVEVQQNSGKFPDVELLPNVDLSMAMSFDTVDGDDDEGNVGDDDNTGDGSPGQKAGKRRRRSDAGVGSSGGDEGAARVAKKARNVPTKRTDRKGKNKGPSHAEFIPDNAPKVSYGCPDNQFRASDTASTQGSFMSSADHRRGPNRFTTSGAPTEPHEAVHPEQVATPPPSTSSTGRSTPESEERQPTRQARGPRLPASMAQKSREDCGTAPCGLSPPRSARAIPAAASTQPGNSRGDSAIETTPDSADNFTLRQLATIVGEPLHRLDLRCPDPPALGKAFAESSTREGPEKSKPAHTFEDDVRGARAGSGGGPFDYNRVPTNV